MDNAAPSFSLAGKTALVTGGNSGIGLGMAEGLAANGAKVEIWGTNPAKNEAALERLSAYGPTVTARICDVGDQAAVKSAFAAAVEQHGRIDACFANAGVSGNAPSFVDMTADEWRRVMRINLDGAFFTAQEAVRHMMHNGGGSVVFTTSGSAYYGQARGQHYGASKAGLVAMSKAIAVEHARHGIRSNAILPGWIESEMTPDTLAWDRFIDKVLPRVPMRRWGDRSDFAGIAVYLASDLSRYHTGDVITIDGGYHSF
jgi:NAD(P)-dependent dehydrogenase (short-subunit alcohol dehydrogenase family)